MADKNEKQQVSPQEQEKPGEQSCVCNMEWRSDREGEEDRDCICTPEPSEEVAGR